MRPEQHRHFSRGAIHVYDLLAVLVALGVLIYLAFRGISLLILAPVLALLAALLTGGMPT